MADSDLSRSFIGSICTQPHVEDDMWSNESNQESSGNMFALFYCEFYTCIVGNRRHFGQLLHRQTWFFYVMKVAHDYELLSSYDFYGCFYHHPSCYNHYVSILLLAAS